MKRNSSSSLAPGFRFHPTDEELVWYYLKRKVSGKSLRFDPISEVDVYKSEPWDLPDKSKLKSRDLEWYFFSVLDKKYGNGSKTNRATEKGYWKTTGKDRAVHHGSRDVGMKKTLVYHLGRAPSGKRTNWVMHEYRLTDLDLRKDGVLQDAFVLCRVFQKSGSGPKNGEQYGAPFVEEEWEDNDEVAVFSEQVGLADEMVFNDDIHVKSNSLNQIVDFGPPPRIFNCGETCKSNDNGQVLNGNDEKLLVGTTSMQHEMDVTSAKAESTVKSSDMDHVDINELLDGLYWDAPDNLAYGGDIQYLETNDLSNPVETNPGNFDPEDFFTFYDAVENQFMTWSSSQPMGMGSSVNDGAFFIQPANGGTEFLPMSTNNGQLTEPADNGHVSWLKHMPETKDFTNGSSSRQVIRKAASSILGSIPAPPAFAAEFPGKDLVQKKLQLDTSSSSIVMGGGNGLLDWSFSKNGAVSVCLSFQVAEDEVSSNIMALPSKFAPWWTQVYSFVSWALFLSVGFKFGCSIFASACQE